MNNDQLREQIREIFGRYAVAEIIRDEKLKAFEPYDSTNFFTVAVNELLELFEKSQQKLKQVGMVNFHTFTFHRGDYKNFPDYFRPVFIIEDK